MLDKFKRLIAPRKADDDTLKDILDLAEASILDFCDRNDLPEQAKPIQLEIACFLFEQRGRRTVKSKSEGAISGSYETELPQSILKRLHKYRKIGVVKRESKFR